jgi:oligoribonuclease NrnB/cAMP/cGMP phosphodiesterase (DHH superfamily)
MENNTNFDIIIYHKSCPDGIASAWIVKQYNPNAIIISSDAGSEPILNTNLKNKRIIFVDVCPNNLYYLIKLSKETEYIMVIDHHISLQKQLNNIKLPNNINIIFDIKNCACILTWEYFTNNKTNILPHNTLLIDNIPWFLKYIEDRDLWKLEMPNSQEVSLGLLEGNYITIEGLTRLYHTEYDMIYNKILEQGKIEIIIKEKLINNQIKYNSIPCKFKVLNKEYLIWFFESNDNLRSDVGNKLLFTKITKNNINKFPDFVVSWRYSFINDQFWFSLRSHNESVNVANIAQIFKGGGHRNAAGFILHSNIKIQNFFIPI